MPHIGISHQLLLRIGNRRNVAKTMGFSVRFCGSIAISRFSAIQFLAFLPTPSGRELIGDVVEAPPYEGEKPSFLIEDQIEDSELVRISVKELPSPKPKKN